MKWSLLSLCCLLGPVAAQKLELADGSERLAVLLDVGDLLGKGPPPALVPGRSAATSPSEVQRVAAFVRAFADPPLGEGADLQALGDRHLVALGSPVQVAAAERLVAHARQTKAKEFLLAVRLCSVPSAFFDRELAGKLVAVVDGQVEPKVGPHVAVLDGEAAKAILLAMKKDPLAEIVQAPQIVVRTMHSATMQIGEQVAYVRDFEIEVAQAAFVANPLVDVLFDGQQVEAICAEVGEGLIGVQMQVFDQSVEKPIRTLKTTVPGGTHEVTVQVPRTTGCRGSQTAVVPNGATAVMAARKNDGTWLLSFLTVNAIGKPAPMAPARKK